MSRLRKTKAVEAEAPKLHYVAIRDLEEDAVHVLPVLQAMQEYVRVMDNGETRAFDVSDFFFESGEPMPMVSVGIMKSLGKGMAAIKKGAKKAGKKLKETAKKAKDAAKKGAEELREGYNEGVQKDEEVEGLNKIVF